MISIEEIITTPLEYLDLDIPFRNDGPLLEISTEVYDKTLRKDGRVVATGFVACAYAYAEAVKEYHLLSSNARELFRKYMECSLEEYEENENKLQKKLHKRDVVKMLYDLNQEWLDKEKLQHVMPQLEYEALIACTRNYLAWMEEEYSYVKDALPAQADDYDSVVVPEYTDDEWTILKKAFPSAPTIIKILLKMAAQCSKPLKYACMIAVLDDYGLVSNRYAHTDNVNALRILGYTGDESSIRKKIDETLKENFKKWKPGGHKSMCDSLETHILNSGIHNINYRY